jgi:hypothetical protein
MTGLGPMFKTTSGEMLKTHLLECEICRIGKCLAGESEIP